MKREQIVKIPRPAGWPIFDISERERQKLPLILVLIPFIKIREMKARIGDGKAFPNAEQDANSGSNLSETKRKGSRRFDPQCITRQSSG